ncbi:MAG TPA: SDR family NAD(P)-dependent oxidoreductase [bacterium]|jgi:2-dehydro-3-deoxy-L-rhamnonate dehydrogenase (NAD+)|nr:SDR family NAD(P)-dependent oxidoreductase [bacterium]
MDGALTGRQAVVTGAARGIGFAIAKRLAAEGAAVTVWDVDAAQGERAAADLRGTGEVDSLAVDVADAAAVDAAARETLRRRGRVDVLVNNAGIAGPNATTWTYPRDAWQKVLDIDLTGVFLCCRALVPAMLERKYGRVVNIASVAGKEGNPNASAYSAAKAGVIALTKSLGKELAGTGVLVNCVTPAAVETDIFAQMTREHIQFMLSKIPMGRFGTADEVAALVAWLASEDCSFSTGAVFDISGGRATY